LLDIRHLIPLLHDEPPALLVAEIKFSNGGDFGRLLIRRLDGPEVLPALPDNRDAPGSQLGGGGPLSRALQRIWEGYAGDTPAR
jgi:hypothetical protein